MALTTLPVALVKKLWGTELWTEAQDEIFWKPFIGTEDPQSFSSGAGNCIIVKKTELGKAKGDSITIPLLAKLTGSGVDGDDTLEGNEEAMQYFDFPVMVNQKRNGVLLEGKMDEQKSAFNMRKSAKEALKVWLAEYIDKNFFNVFGTTPTAGRILYGGDATMASEIVDADVLSTALISKAKLRATMASPKFRPLKIKGKEYYIMMVHPYAAYNLKQEEKWVNAQKDANVRGEDNPIFSGMLGIWDGVILHSHENVRLTTDGAASANVAWNTLLGAHAGAWAVAKESEWEEEDFDYKNKHGFATGIIHGFEKSVFNGEDMATLTVVTGAQTV